MNRVTQNNSKLTSDLLKSLNKFGHATQSASNPKTEAERMSEYIAYPADMKMLSALKPKNSEKGSFDIVEKTYWENYTIAMTLPQNADGSQYANQLPISGDTFLQFSGKSNSKDKPSPRELFANRVSSLQNKLLQGTIRPLCIRKNHWVAIFVDRNNKKVIYFDSVKAGKDSEITSLSNHDIDSKDQYDPNFKISTASDDLKVFHKLMLQAIGQDYKNYKIIRNNTKFQYNGFDCGPWTALFCQFFRKNYPDKNFKDGQSMDDAFKQFIQKRVQSKYSAQNIGQKIRTYFQDKYILPRLRFLQKKYNIKINISKKINLMNKASSSETTSSVLSSLLGMIALLFTPTAYGIICAIAVVLISYNLLNHLFNKGKKPRVNTTKPSNPSKSFIKNRRENSSLIPKNAEPSAQKTQSPKHSPV